MLCQWISSFLTAFPNLFNCPTILITVIMIMTTFSKSIAPGASTDHWKTKESTSQLIIARKK